MINPVPPLPTSPPIRLSLLQNLTTQSLLISQLFTLLASPPPPSSSGSSSIITSPIPAQISQLYAALQLSTLDLSALVREAHAHQEEWRALMDKRSEVERLERRVRGLVKGLEKGREELEGMVEKGREVLNDIDRSESAPIHVKTLLSHAQALSRHSSAPVSSLLAPVDKAQYTPWPTEMSMRQGLLFQLEGSMSGMGEKGVVGDETAVAQPREERREEAVQHEEPGRRYDPNAVFHLELNSDDSDDD
ncbi:hypothetical protein CI109_105772 [Kwoniella shandongensis]|uniref:Mediator of RNA polymerase II transcription subunit 4 n=1 Tax=Kwoniella shandongensis TaxID=1734106 RepID=A0A5M6C5W7_9TREE|nr:uncharacterized protein CI109_003111 [Kwoniella shandongensis]KAA5528579.1 hypothetical protein CI109_003111 [Kwoniella shandongensis]